MRAAFAIACSVAVAACARLEAPPRDGDARACAGADAAWIALRRDVTAVEALRETTVVAKIPMTRVFGVVLHVRATPGMTPQWLTRLAACRLASRAAVTARVIPDETGFALALRSDDPDVAAALVHGGRAALF